MVKLRALIEGLDIISSTADYDAVINKIEFFSKSVAEGDLFVCMSGIAADGNDFALEALRNGAAALVTEKDLGDEIPHIRVRSARSALAVLSANYFKNPAKDLKVIGITGTNGKTTTAYILNEILKKCGKTTGYIGTLYYEIAGARYRSEMTTPDPFLFNNLLFEMREAGAEYVITEVSAHAIYLEKLHGIRCDIGIFTNLSQDHLDYFDTLEKYKEVKKSFFKKQNCKLSIINIDDPVGKEILRDADMPVITYGLKNPSDTFALGIKCTAYGTGFVLNVYDEINKVTTNMAGKFNVYNVMAAATAACSLGLKLDAVARALSEIEPPEGRFNMYFRGGVRYIIDYAHTPDGLENLLKAAKETGTGQLIAVFGCGGNRDRSKRPLMGEAAEAYADKIILTKDNSRFEKPEAIINDIKEGIIAKNKTEEIVDRAAAIGRAVELASPGDVVVIAGKGAEDYIEECGEKTYFSDSDCLVKLIGK